MRLPLDVARVMELSRKQQKNVYSILRRNLLDSLIQVGEHSTFLSTQDVPTTPPKPSPLLCTLSEKNSLRIYSDKMKTESRKEDNKFKKS